MELTAIALKKAAHDEHKRNERARAVEAAAAGGSAEGARLSCRPGTAAATAAAMAASAGTAAGGGGADATADANVGGGCIKEQPVALAGYSGDVQIKVGTDTTTMAAVGAVAVVTATALDAGASPSRVESSSSASASAAPPVVPTAPALPPTAALLSPRLTGAAFADAKKPSSIRFTTDHNAGTISESVSMSASVSHAVSGGPITGSLYSADRLSQRDVVAPCVSTSMSRPFYAAGGGTQRQRRRAHASAHLVHKCARQPTPVAPQHSAIGKLDERCAAAEEAPSTHFTQQQSAIEGLGDR